MLLIDLNTICTSLSFLFYNKSLSDAFNSFDLNNNVKEWLSLRLKLSKIRKMRLQVVNKLSYTHLRTPAHVRAHSRAQTNTDSQTDTKKKVRVTKREAVDRKREEYKKKEKENENEKENESQEK